ncbi:MAG TPA: hypothetical protein PKD24_14735 [Pyrinomonadaceae bacterium]|nr:hypothetical protein [Pyrinomonadaceae bacterium]HMP66630.1 hypothetical protein [Pyrinomonadaceae bacterium]
MSTSFDRHLFDRRLFFWIAVAFIIVSFVGFARTYFLLPFIGGEGPPVKFITHIHALVMTLWVALFATQVYLVRSKNIKTHMRLGTAGIGLGAVVIVVGIMTAIAAAKYGSASSPAEIPPLQFMIVPVGDIVVFTILFAAALYYRKVPANHKRLMLLTVFNFVPAAFGRVVPLTEAIGPLWFYGAPALILLAVLAIDTWKNGTLNRIFLAGTAFVIGSQVFRLAFMSSEAWLAVARWMTGE